MINKTICLVAALATISTVRAASEQVKKDIKNVRVGCTAELDGFYYNLHPLSKDIDQ